MLWTKTVQCAMVHLLMYVRCVFKMRHGGVQYLLYVRDRDKIKTCGGGGRRQRSILHCSR